MQVSSLSFKMCFTNIEIDFCNLLEMALYSFASCRLSLGIIFDKRLDYSPWMIFQVWHGTAAGPLIHTRTAGLGSYLVR